MFFKTVVYELELPTPLFKMYTRKSYIYLHDGSRFIHICSSFIAFWSFISVYSITLFEEIQTKDNNLIIKERRLKTNPGKIKGFFVLQDFEIFHVFLGVIL